MSVPFLIEIKETDLKQKQFRYFLKKWMIGMNNKEEYYNQAYENHESINERVSSKRRKTHEQFLSEIQSVNTNIDILGEYVKSNEKICVRCKICDHIWYATPSKLLLGRSCPICARKKVGDARRNSFDKVVQRLKDVNPYVEILGEYVSTDKPIECRCLKCNYIWKPTISNLYAGKGCPKCSGCYKRSPEEFVNELHLISPDIEVIGTYVNSRTKVKCRCKECGYIWETTPSSLLSGTGCRNCAVNNWSHTNRVNDDVRVFTHSHESFVKEIYKNDKNSTIILMDNYVNSTTKLQCRCIKCGYEWMATPYSLKKGKGCPQCNHRVKTDVYFRQQIKESGFEIDVLEEYKGAHSKLKCCCQKCGFVFEATAHSILQGHGCPKCSQEKVADSLRKTQEEFVKELAEIQPDILVIGEYKKNNKRIKCKCLNCNHVWSIAPQDLLAGKGCPECNGRSGTSFVEQMISISFERSLGTDMVFNRDRQTIGMELDIYIPKLKLAIEPGSWIWHKNKTQRDKTKKQLCKEKGIRLVIIYDSMDLGISFHDDDYYIYYHSLSDSKYYNDLKDLIVELLEQYKLDSHKIIESFDEIVIEAKRRSRRRGTKRFIEEMELVNDNIEIIGEFHRVHEKIECKCKKCGYIWQGIPSGLLSGAGCPKCNGGYKKTHQEFISQLSDIAPSIEVLGNYVRDDKKILCKCRVCGNEWSPLATSLIQGHGCPKCASNKLAKQFSITHEQFVEKLNVINPSIDVLGNYINARTKVLCKCKICGNEWEPIPDTLINRGAGCPVCARKRAAEKRRKNSQH